MPRVSVSDLEPIVPVNNSLQDFADGAMTSFSLDVGLLVIRALVNTATLMISAEVGVHAPFCGYSVLSSVRGSLRDRVQAHVNGPLARGSVTFYLDGRELWVELDLLGPLFPITSGTFKVTDLATSTSNPPLPEPAVKRELEG